MLAWQPLVSACCGLAGNTIIAVMEVHPFFLSGSHCYDPLTVRRCKLLALSPVVRLV